MKQMLFILTVLFCNSVLAIELTDAFDFGVLPAYTVKGDTVVFDLTAKERVDRILKDRLWICCLVRDAPEKLLLQFRMSETAMKLYAHQGFYISTDGIHYEQVDFTKAGEMLMQAEVKPLNGSLFVATSIPYGRDQIDQLLIDTTQTGQWKMLHRDGRSVAMFELGTDDGQKPIHYIWAEDTYETAGAWVVNHMIRTLNTNPELARQLTEKAVIRIMPVISLYSQNAGNGSYTGINGEAGYGGGSWNKNPLPPELSLVHDMVVRTIHEKRLGFVLTVHSWFSQSPTSAIETIQTAGTNTLSREQMDWAQTAMNIIMDGVSGKKIYLPEKAWNHKVFRQISLADFNAMTFRIEISTRERALNDYADIAEKMMINLVKIDDWSPVLGDR